MSGVAADLPLATDAVDAVDVEGDSGGMGAEIFGFPRSPSDILLPRLHKYTSKSAEQGGWHG